MTRVDDMLAEMWRSEYPRRMKLLKELLESDPEEIAPDVLRDAYKLHDTEEEALDYPPSTQVLEELVPTHPDILVKMLQHPDYEVRAGAAYEMQWRYEGRSIDALLQSVRSDPHPEVQYQALVSIWDFAGESTAQEIDQSELIEALTRFLDHKEERFRQMAAAALKNLRGQSTGSMLAGFIDHSEEVRHNSAEAFGKAGNPGNPELIPLFIRELKKTDDLRIRTEIIEALGRLKAEEAVPYLLTSLEDNRKPFRKSYHDRLTEVTCVALEQIATPEALAAARKWRQTQREEKAQVGARRNVFIAFLNTISAVYGEIRNALDKILHRKH